MARLRILIVAGVAASALVGAGSAQAISAAKTGAGIVGPSLAITTKGEP